MPRSPRSVQHADFYHVLNRGNARQKLFMKGADYRAFTAILAEAPFHAPMRLLAYCLMPNHWHLVLWPDNVLALSAYMHWITSTHVRRWIPLHRPDCGGHVYQGRYKSVPLRGEAHLLTALRYVEANAVRAGLVNNALNWRWSSATATPAALPILTAWPVSKPPDWLALLNNRGTGPVST